MGIGKRKSTRAQVTSLAVLCTMAAGGCATSSHLQQAFENGPTLQGVAAEAVLAEIERRDAPASIAGAVGFTGRGLVGRVLPDGPLWEYLGPVETLPVIDGGFVALSGGGSVTLLDLGTGQTVWTVPSGGRQLSSMAHDGDLTLVVLADPDDSRAQLALVVDSSGSVLHRALSEPALGRPAALAGLALVPSAGRYVSVIDLAAGSALGRFVVEGATTAVVTDPLGVLLFGQGVMRLSDAVLGDARPAPLRLPSKDLPGAPRWPVDGTVTLGPVGLPVAIYAHPLEGAEHLRLAHAAFASTYHRVVLGFGARVGELRWATHFLRDVLGGAASRTSLTVCLEDGSLWRLAWSNGSRAPSGSLQSRLVACVVSPDPRPVEVSRAVPLAEQVASTLTDTGPEMAPVHQLLLDELASNRSPEVTRLLVEIARSPRASAALAEQAGRRIAMRRTGAEYLVAALRDSMDFDVRKRPAPLGAIASALFVMNAREGAEPLAQHLVDPRTAMIDQLMLARVLRQLAGPEQVPELREYFSLYRTAAGEPELIQAVLLTAQTLWTVGGEASRDLVLEAARDPMTHPSLRPELEKFISAAAAQEPDGAQPDGPQPAGPDAAGVTSGAIRQGVVHP